MRLPCGKSRATIEQVYTKINSVIQLEKSFMEQRGSIEAYFNKEYNQNWDSLIFKVLSFEPIEIEETSTGEKL